MNHLNVLTVLIIYKFYPQIFTLLNSKKRGLPHAHILLFLHPSNKYPTPKDTDKIVSTKLPDQNRDPILHECIKNHMIHGPCRPANRHSPCKKDGKCSKFFHKRFQQKNIC